MFVALTGTPGTGKSSAGMLLKGHELRVIELGDLAREHGLLRDIDEARGSYDIDPNELQDAVDSLEDAPVTILIGINGPRDTGI
jgi:broad-specificity NMP kinase